MRARPLIALSHLGRSLTNRTVLPRFKSSGVDAPSRPTTDKKQSNSESTVDRARFRHLSVNPGAKDLDSATVLRNDIGMKADAFRSTPIVDSKQLVAAALRAQAFLNPLRAFTPPEAISQRLPDKPIRFTNVVRDFIQSAPSLDQQQTVEVLIRTCLDPAFTLLEFGSLLPEPDQARLADPTAKGHNLHQLFERMAYSEPLFETFLSRIADSPKDVKEIFTGKPFMFLVPNVGAASRFIALANRAKAIGITTTPAIFVSACPDYSQKNKNKSPQEDALVSKAIATQLYDELGVQPHLYVSCYNGGNPGFDGPLSVNHDNTLAFATSIPYASLRLGDTFGKSTPETHGSALTALHAESIEMETVACHFHYDEAHSTDDNLVRTTGLVAESVIQGVLDFDGNSFSGGAKNPLTSSTAQQPKGPSGNLQYSQLLGIAAALNLTVQNLTSEGDAVGSMVRIMLAQQELFPQTPDLGVSLKVSHIQSACDQLIDR